MAFGPCLSTRGGAAFDPSKLGLHAAAFVLRSGLLAGAANQAAREALCGAIKATLGTLFPINKSAARLSSPSKRSAAGFYTPYFQTFTFEGLCEAGEADFVVQQYEQAWGWALTQSSTWVEVSPVVGRTGAAIAHRSILPCVRMMSKRGAR